MDNHDILSRGTQLLNKLDESKPEVKVITEADPFFILRNDILSFFRQIMGEVSKKEALKHKIEDSFLEDLESDTLDFQSRMSLYKLISTQSNVSVDSILSLFKPTPGAPSLLADNISREKEKTHFDEMYENMSPDDLQNVSKLMAFMTKVMQKEKDENDS